MPCSVQVLLMCVWTLTFVLLMWVPCPELRFEPVFRFDIVFSEP